LEGCKSCVDPTKLLIGEAAAEGCRAEDAVFIGDSLVDDIMGPKACGIATVLIDRKKNHSLSALPKEQIPDRIFPDLTLLTDEYSQL
jgi:FMN phosphatase YigB (HAD superfamily)